MTAAAEPSLATIARGLSQYAEEQRETRARLDAHIEASSRYFLGMERIFDGLRDTISAQHLLVAGDIAATRRDIAAPEDHVGLVTTIVTAHGARLDAIDGRLDGIDTRLDGIDTRLDGIDTRLDGIDTRLDGIDTRLDGIDTRLEGIDARLDAHDKRFDQIDARLDTIDARLDAHDKRFDRLDVRLDGLTDLVVQIRDAVLPGPH